jgi:hypothetical protein
MNNECECALATNYQVAEYYEQYEKLFSMTFEHCTEGYGGKMLRQFHQVLLTNFPSIVSSMEYEAWVLAYAEMLARVALLNYIRNLKDRNIDGRR